MTGCVWWGLSATDPAACDARRVFEPERECPSAHRACDGDPPAGYLKGGAASWIVAYEKLAAVSASLNVPPWAARLSRMKSPTHLAGRAGGLALSPTRTKKLFGSLTHRPPRMRNDVPLTWTRAFAGPHHLV